MWKRVCGTVILILLTAVALYPKKFMLCAARYCATAYCQYHFASHLKLQNIQWQDGQFILQEGELTQEGRQLAAFETLTFRPSIKFKKRLWGGELQIAKLRVWQSANLQPLSFMQSSTSSYFFRPCLHVCILDAVLIQESFKDPIALDLTLHLQTTDMLAHMTVRASEQPLDLLLSMQDKKCEVAVTFQHHPLVALQAISHLIPMAHPALSTWQIQQGEIDGHLTACFEQNILMHCRTNLQVNDFVAKYADGQEQQSISKCHAQFEMTQGELLRAELTGNIFGMQTDFLLDWSDPSHVMQLHCEGAIDQLLPFAPSKLQYGLQQACINQKLFLQGTLSRNHQGLELNGSIKDGQQHECEFGCQLPASSSFHAQTNSMSKLRQQFCLFEGFLGWFAAQNMPIETFLAPFLFGPSYLTFCGNVDLEGNFNERYITLFYQGRDIKLEAESFCLYLPSLKESGVHYFDLHSAEHVGYLPMQGAYYAQKNCQFVMPDITAILRVEQNTLSFQNIATTWHGLPLLGQVDIQIHSTQDIDVALNFGCTQGSLLAGQQLLQHFANTPLNQLSMQGTFGLDLLETTILFHFSPQMEILQGKIKGHAFFELDLVVVPLKEGKASFTYDFGAKSLKFDHLEASTMVCGRLMELSSEACWLDPETWRMKGVLQGVGPEPLCLEAIWQNDIDVVAQGVCIHGSVQNLTLSLDQIRWEAYQGSAELYSDNDHYCLKYLTMAHPKMGRCEISGQWDSKVKEAHGQIVLEALDLAQLLPTKTGPWGVVGTVSGRGEIDWNPSTGFDFTMQGEHRNLEFGSLQFGNSDDLTVSYQSQKGFRLEGLEALGLYRLGALHYDPGMQRAYFDGFDFVLTSDKLPWLMEVASTLFAGKVYPSTLDFLSKLKQEGSLCGRLWIDLTPQNLWLHLQMQDGEYYFAQQKWNLQDFSLVYDPQEIHIKTGLRLGQVDSRIHLTADSQYLSKGSIVLGQDQEDDLLTASWRKDPDFGYVIEDVQGSFAGISCSLSHFSYDVDAFHCEGSISCRPQTTSELFSKSIQRWIQKSQIAGTCCLKGKFSFFKNDRMHPHFIGELIGSDLSYATIALASTTCQCEMTPQKIELKNIAVRDWAGDLFCDHLRLFNQEGWHIEADHIALHDFRLSRLDSTWTKRERGDRPVFRSLFINECEMHHVHGKLGDKNSLCAEGHVQFTHTVRRTLFTNLMTIPIEITARIGLDLTALVPAKGTIHYKMEEGKIHLLDFEDVYSDSKHSRFYLADNQSSYINLDGELNIYVKMKQYNLLMKLAELFTLTIKGTLCAPQYMLSSQNVDPIREL